MKILLSGGGTLGPVAPLIAIYEKYRKKNPNSKFFWVGTSKGPERELVESYSIPYYVIAAGKLRRYYSLWNIIDIFKIGIAFFQSLILLWQEKPSLLISAGGFVSVPLHMAAFALGIPTWIHQQDVRIGLANKIMAVTACKITVALQGNISCFSKRKAEWIGNPVRDLTTNNLEKSYKNLDLANEAPVILVFGGGTGSDKLNNLVLEMLPHIDKRWQVIHLTGKQKMKYKFEKAVGTFSNYHPFQFFTSKMKDAYAVSSVVIGRGGFVTISELASLSKPAVLLPIPQTHQEENVNMLAENKAAIILNQFKVNGLDLAHICSRLINEPLLANALGKNLRELLPPTRAEKMEEIIKELSSK